jgi:site-specific DNA-methyltransferase (adenine-specific)
MSAQIFQADILQWAAQYAGTKFHAAFCDAPYELGFMGKEWDKSGISFQPSTWAVISTCLLPGAMLFVFGGTRTWHRLACAIEDAGFEIRDTIMWVYGTGFPKSHTALKPAWEPIIVARSKITGTAQDNAVQYGTSALNISGCKVVERYPANLIYDGSNEALAIFPHTSPSPKQTKQKNSHAPQTCNTYGVYSDVGRVINGHNDSGSAARFFYCAKASKHEREVGCEKLPTHEPAYRENGLVVDRTWIDRKDGKGAVAVHARMQPRHNHHPTVKPLALCEYLARLILPPAAYAPRRLLVPFAGSGSEMIGAYQAGWEEVVGVELQEEYCTIARARMQHWCEAHQLHL